MEIIPRARWFATYPAGFGPAPPASELWLHHSVTRSAGPRATLADDVLTVQQLERVGQQRFGKGISYTFVVTASGRVFEGTGPLRVGAHTGGRNTRSRAICFLGDHTSAPPTGVAVESAAELVAHGHAHGWWTVDRLSGGHRDAPGASTSCPGDAAHACLPAINRRAILRRSDVSLTAEQARKLDVIYDELTKRLANRYGPNNAELPGYGADTLLGWAALGAAFGFRDEHLLTSNANALHAIQLALGEANRRLAEVVERLVRLENKP